MSASAVKKSVREKREKKKSLLSRYIMKVIQHLRNAFPRARARCALVVEPLHRTTRRGTGIERPRVTLPYPRPGQFAPVVGAGGGGGNLFVSFRFPTPASIWQHNKVDKTQRHSWGAVQAQIAVTFSRRTGRSRRRRNRKRSTRAPLKASRIPSSQMPTPSRPPPPSLGQRRLSPEP